MDELQLDSQRENNGVPGNSSPQKKAAPEQDSF